MNARQFQRNLDYAKQLHELAEGEGLTLDAVFLAVCASRAPRTSAPEDDEEDLPEWFKESLETLKGRRLTVGQFLLLSGRAPVSKVDANHAGRLLRRTGRYPVRTGGQSLFTI